jgi:nicotinamidase-related amidase
MADLSRIVPSRTAMVVIDLQKMILARDTHPYSADHVLSKSVAMANALRAAGGLVVCVHVSFSPDFGDRLRQTTDTPAISSQPEPGYDEIPDSLMPALVVKKRQWGAFYGNDLDLQLRRRGIDTIVLCGIATNLGVESTARGAYEHGYQLYLVEDAMATFTDEEHSHTVKYIFQRLGHVCASEAIVRALGPS